MSCDNLDIYLSIIDEERFGVRTARVDHATHGSLAAALHFCRAKEVKFLIARCPVSDLTTAQAMEQAGFLLMDTLVYSTRDLLRNALPADTPQVSLRPLRPGEEAAVQVIAATAFRDYCSHYHADSRLERAKCDETYISWAVRSCVSRDVADAVVVADQDGSLVGFMTMRLNSPAEGTAILGGVLPAAQGKGIYRSCLIYIMNWCLTQGATRMVVSTQITNTAVQKVWTRLGFEPSQAVYTFHKWFESS